MIETNIPNLSVEEIMKRIKEEVEKRKQKLNGVATPLRLQTETDKKHKIYKLNSEPKSIINKKEIPFVFKDMYEYADFTKYHDEEFQILIFLLYLRLVYLQNC